MAKTGSQPATAYTWADFLELDEDDGRQLIDGQLVEVDVPSQNHERIVALLAFYLVGWARAHGGRVLTSGYRVRVDDRRGAMPDLQYFTPGQVAALPEAGLTEDRPELAVEVISPGSRRYDRVVKLNWYLSLGIPEYWIVDPLARTIERLELVGGRYAITDALGDEGVFAPASFAGLEIPLEELFG